MQTLDDIRQPVSEDIRRYEDLLKNSFSSDNPTVNSMLDYVFSNRGKGVRPLMTLLSAALFNGSTPLPAKSHLAAMIIEMIHTATLVHDDVIDEAFIRRDKPSVNALWRSQRAVLVGDYILAKSFSTGMDEKAYEIVGYITGCMADICEGELIQSEQSDLLEMNREIYNSIIYKKTATLIGTSCGAGAISAGADSTAVAKMKELGDAAGMAFQIKDDILDYKPSVDTGKPTCGDLRERKITLPLLIVLEKATGTERKQIIRLLSDIRHTPRNAEKLYNLVVEAKGPEMAAEIMQEYIDKAISLLRSFPESIYRESLAGLFRFIASREK